MSKTLDDLQAYHDRKRDRRDDHARNMQLYMDMGERGLEQANIELKRANVLTEVMETIEHCMLLVRRNEQV
jgi:hypothetical protein